MSGAYTAFGVLAMPMGNLAAKQAIAAAGCTHTVVQAQWIALQPNGPGTALVDTAVTAIVTEYEQAAETGLAVMLEVALHYAPTWVISDVEAFTDQAGNVWSATEASGSGVANWQWTALGWQYVTDLVDKLAAGIGSACVAQTAAIKIGGGCFGELHYPASSTTAPEYSHWGYGTSMQTGTGLASGQVVCPEPGYVIYSGTDAEDSEWLNWYLNGLGTWLMFFIETMRTAGWDCDFHVCHPGYGIRSNQTHSESAYQQSAGVGEDPARMIGVYSHDPKIWPYCTWMNTADGYDPSAVDSDISAWKKVYEEAFARNKHFKLWGENTGGESNSGMDGIFSGGEWGSALSDATYGDAPAETYGFQGIMWLQYSTLTGGASGQATLANYEAAIAAHTPTLGGSGGSTPPAATTYARAATFPTSLDSAGGDAVSVNLQAVGDTVIVYLANFESTSTPPEPPTCPDTGTFALVGTNNANGLSVSVYQATVTTTGASTVTVTPPTGSTQFETIIDSIHSSLGSSAAWTFGPYGSTSAASTTAVTYPSLATGANAGVYSGYAAVGGSPSAGATAGFSYSTTTDADQLVVNTDLAASTTYVPTATEASGYLLTGAVICYAT